MILMQKSPMHCSSFDFDFSSVSDFEAAETQFKLEPIDLVKTCGQFRTSSSSAVLAPSLGHTIEIYFFS